MGTSIPVGNYMFKVNNRNTRARCKICSKLTIKTPERRQWRRSGVFIDNFEHFTPCSKVPIINFEKVNAGWDGTRLSKCIRRVYRRFLEKTIIISGFPTILGYRRKDGT